jgi:hypothetical protein
MNKKILLFATLFSVFSGQFVEAGKKDGKKADKKADKKARKNKRQGNHQQGQPQWHNEDDAILAEAAAAAAVEAAASSASASAGTGSRRAGYPSAAAAAAASRQAGYFGGSNGGGRDEEAAAASAASAHRTFTAERIKSMFLNDPDIHVQGILNKKIREIVQNLGDYPITKDLNDMLDNIYQTKTTIHKSIQKIEDEIVNVINSIVRFVINNSDTFSVLLKKQAEDILLIARKTTSVSATSLSSDNRSKLESELSIVNANIVIRLQDSIFNQINVKNALRRRNTPFYKQVYKKLPELLAKLDDLYKELERHAESVFRDFEPIIQAKQEAKSATVLGQGYPSAAAAAAASVAQQAAQKESRSSASQSGGGCDEDALGEDFKTEFQRAIRKDNVEAINQCCFELRARGNNVNTFSIFNNDCNALFFAVSQGKVGAIKHLIENCGANVMAHNKKGNNILHYAAAYQGDSDSWHPIMSYLFQDKDRKNNFRRADFINKVNYRGQTPLDRVRGATADDKTDREKSLLSLGAKKGRIQDEAGGLEEDAASASASTGVSGGAAAVVAQATQPTICEIVLKNDGSPIPLSSSEKCSFMFFVEQNGLLSLPIHVTINIENQHTKEKNYSVFDLKLDLQNQAGQRIFLFIRKPDGVYPQGLALDITEHLLDIKNKKTPGFAFLRHDNDIYSWSFSDSMKTQGIRKTTDGRWEIIPK